MIIKYFVPIDRFVLQSSLSADALAERLRSVSQPHMPLLSMSGESAPWQGVVCGHSFKLRNAITSAARGRGYSAVVAVGRIRAAGSGSQLIAWQRFSLGHMVMMLVMLGFVLAFAGANIEEPLPLLPLAALWLMFVITFQVSSSRQRSALSELVRGGE